MNKYPMRKSVYWILFHKQELLFNIFLFLTISIVSMIYAIAIIKKSPAGIILFVLSIYGIYFFIANIVKLYKEFKK